MPFVVCTRESGSILENGTFNLVESAQTLIKELREQGKVAFIRQVESNISWYEREKERFESGFYIETPWHDESWHIPHKNLFAHVSIEDNNRIAYTASNDHGMQDRQTRIKVGRYLCMVGCPDVNYWVAQFNRLYSDNTVQFATTANDFQYVYENGPDSCMSHKGDDYSSPCHPVRVYAYGDLHLAYLKDEDRITARCLVRPSNKTYCRIYGDESRLGNALEKLGYSEDWDSTLDKARLTRIEADNGVVMPYLDAIYAADYYGNHLVITSNGDISCQETHGIAGESRDECCQCGDWIDEEDSMCDESGDTWCSTCFDRYHTSCTHCGESFHEDSGIGVTSEDGDFYCDNCTRRYLTRCDDCCGYFQDGDITVSDSDDASRCETCHDKHCDELSEMYNSEVYASEFENMIGITAKVIEYGFPTLYTSETYDIEFSWEKVYDTAILDNLAYDALYMSVIHTSIPMLPLYL